MTLSADLSALGVSAAELEQENEAFARDNLRLVDEVAALGLDQTRLEDALTGKTLELGAALSKVSDLEAALKACQDAHGEPPVEPPVEPPKPLGTLIGMSADLWDQRLAEVGPGLRARRLFGQHKSVASSDFLHPADDIARAKAELAAGRVPVLSFKTPAWADVADGMYDSSALAAIREGLAGLNGTSYVVLHHEPGNDGTAADWVNMQLHALPRLKAPNVKVGVIVNGFWWNAKGGRTDSFIGSYLPASLLGLLDFLGGDFYQAEDGAEEPAPKIARFVTWAATRGIKAFGIGEFNSFTADGSGLKAVGELVKADPRFLFACVWNTDAERSAVLTGQRLAAFKALL